MLSDLDPEVSAGRAQTRPVGEMDRYPGRWNFSGEEDEVLTVVLPVGKSDALLIFPFSAQTIQKKKV